MSNHMTHETLPSGFSYADTLQIEAFLATGSVNGAAKVAYVAGAGELPRLAVRLRPPHRWGAVVSPVARRFAGRTGFVVDNDDNREAHDWYVREYKNGWAAAGRGTDSVAWDSGTTSAAWDDGYLDRAGGRMKWHLTYCPNHDECGEG